MARTRAQDYEEKRALILKRSARLFAERGFTGASIMMIADACGVSKALLYHYYRDKESVLFDIVDTHLRELVEVAEAALRPDLSPGDQLDALCAALLDAYRDADAEHQVQLANLKLLSPERQEALKSLERRLVAIFSGSIEAAVPALAGRPALLKPLTMSLFGMLNWHYLWFREGKGMSRRDYARLVRDLVLAGAAARVAAPQPEPAA
ncbi:TetR/AcrR family transcriptional regulator [Aureimonas populi]|uniref:TetR/AcrR family transcriptional regulator n=1 Tax=Aureimonas populi TaxID=1701758 RepID=A0ABW5CFF3_9HYPH|nr:TetR/AcrR family transcriptional regulator [Aureimonas populi]